MTYTFFGTSACIPEPGGDSPSVLVGGRILVDSGWHVLDNLEKSGAKPEDVTLLLFTHLHHDHYMSLPQLLFYFAMRNPAHLERLVIAGPRGETAETVRLAWDFLKTDRFFASCPYPTVKELNPGEVFFHEGYLIQTAESRHPVPGLLLRITETASGKTLCMTGDTAFFDAQKDFFRGGDVIISETALGTAESSGANNYGHSTVGEAVNVADGAGIPLMYPIHLSPERLRAAVKYAQEKRVPGFGAKYPTDFEEYEI